MAKVNAGGLALSRGISLTSDDKLRGWVIERLMCDYAFSLTDVSAQFGAPADEIIDLAKRLAREDQDGLFKITPEAWPFARIIAARFDAWLALAPRQYSKAV